MPKLKVDRREQLVALCRWHSIVSIAELGVLYGKTTRILLKNLPEILVWAVDKWEHGDPLRDPIPETERRSPDDSGYRSYSDVNMEQAMKGVIELANEYPDRLVVMPMSTLQAAELFPDGALDAIFLDADHTTQAVKADLRAWVPKVRAGGVILGHDYAFHSVNTALDELLPGWAHHHAGVWSMPRDDVDMNLLGATEGLGPDPAMSPP